MSFAPAWRNGLVFLGILFVIFLAGSGLSFYLMLQSPINGLFFVYLLLGLIGFALTIWMLYRWLALRNAFYVIERNGIRLHWGLRVEEIPMSSIRWVRSVQEVQQILKRHLPQPFASLPGAILGQRRLADGNLLDYLASDINHMILIATDERVFVISPSKQQEFIFTMQRIMELGSISPWQRRSQYPTIIINQVWQNRWARWLLISGLLISLGLLAWVSLLIPQLPEIYLTISAEEPSPSTYLLLLPLLNVFFFLLNTILGIYFYRRGVISENIPPTSNDMLGSINSDKIYAYLLWGTSLVTSFFFYFAISFTSYVG
ncbi:MAG: PH domain-containing protein [Anaerolineales bacterium]